MITIFLVIVPFWKILLACLIVSAIVLLVLGLLYWLATLMPNEICSVIAGGITGCLIMAVILYFIQFAK